MLVISTQTIQDHNKLHIAKLRSSCFLDSNSMNYGPPATAENRPPGELSFKAISAMICSCCQLPILRVPKGLRVHGRLRVPKVRSSCAQLKVASCGPRSQRVRLLDLSLSGGFVCHPPDHPPPSPVSNPPIMFGGLI